MLKRPAQDVKLRQGLIGFLCHSSRPPYFSNNLLQLLTFLPFTFGWKNKACVFLFKSVQLHEFVVWVRMERSCKIIETFLNSPRYRASIGYFSRTPGRSDSIYLNSPLRDAVSV